MAIACGLARWKALTRYRDDGRMRIGNSAAARALDFGPLPPAMAERLKARLDSIAPGAGT